MSRSYKHTPYFGQRKCHEMKRIANHRVRQKLKNPEFILKGNDYRKVTNTWDICDYCFISTFEEFYNREMSKWRIWGKSNPPSRKEVWNEYCRLFKRK